MVKFNRNKLIGIIVIVTIIWGVNIFYHKSKRIEKPIFFRHIIETDIGFQLVLSYIEDKDSKDNIYYVKIPELSNEPIYINDYMGNGRSSVYSDKNYNYCLLNIEFNKYLLTYDEKTEKHIPKIKGNRVITKITYVTVKGKEYTEDVGRIYVKDYKERSEPKFLKEYLYANSTSHTVGEKFSVMSGEYIVDKGVKFTGYGGYFKKEIENIFDITVNGVKLQDIKFPMNLKEKYHIKANVKKDLDKNNDIADFYAMNLDLYFENSKGEKEVVPFEIVGRGYPMNYGDVGKKEVDNIIKLRGENSEGKPK